MRSYRIEWEEATPPGDSAISSVPVEAGYLPPIKSVAQPQGAQQRYEDQGTVRDNNVNTSTADGHYTSTTTTRVTRTIRNSGDGNAVPVSSSTFPVASTLSASTSAGPPVVIRRIVGAAAATSGNDGSGAAGAVVPPITAPLHAPQAQEAGGTTSTSQNTGSISVAARDIYPSGSASASGAPRHQSTAAAAAAASPRVVRRTIRATTPTPSGPLLNPLVISPSLLPRTTTRDGADRGQSSGTVVSPLMHSTSAGVRAVSQTTMQTPGVIPFGSKLTQTSSTPPAVYTINTVAQGRGKIREEISTTTEVLPPKTSPREFSASSTSSPAETRKQAVASSAPAVSITTSANHTGAVTVGNRREGSSTPRTGLIKSRSLGPPPQIGIDIDGPLFRAAEPGIIASSAIDSDTLADAMGFESYIRSLARNTQKLFGGGGNAVDHSSTDEGTTTTTSQQRSVDSTATMKMLNSPRSNLPPGTTSGSNIVENLAAAAGVTMLPFSVDGASAISKRNPTPNSVGSFHLHTGASRADGGLAVQSAVALALMQNPFLQETSYLTKPISAPKGAAPGLSKPEMLQVGCRPKIAGVGADFSSAPTPRFELFESPETARRKALEAHKPVEPVRVESFFALSGDREGRVPLFSGESSSSLLPVSAGGHADALAYHHEYQQHIPPETSIVSARGGLLDVKSRALPAQQPLLISPRMLQDSHYNMITASAPRLPLASSPRQQHVAESLRGALRSFGFRISEDGQCMQIVLPECAHPPSVRGLVSPAQVASCAGLLVFSGRARMLAVDAGVSVLPIDSLPASPWIATRGGDHFGDYWADSYYEDQQNGISGQADSESQRASMIFPYEANPILSSIASAMGFSSTGKTPSEQEREAAEQALLSPSAAGTSGRLLFATTQELDALREQLDVESLRVYFAGPDMKQGSQSSKRLPSPADVEGLDITTSEKIRSVSLLCADEGRRLSALSLSTTTTNCVVVRLSALVACTTPVLFRPLDTADSFAGHRIFAGGFLANSPRVGTPFGGPRSFQQTWSVNNTNKVALLKREFVMCGGRRNNVQQLFHSSTTTQPQWMLTTTLYLRGRIQQKYLKDSYIQVAPQFLVAFEVPGIRVFELAEDASIGGKTPKSTQENEKNELPFVILSGTGSFWILDESGQHEPGAANPGASPRHFPLSTSTSANDEASRLPRCSSDENSRAGIEILRNNLYNAYAAAASSSARRRSRSGHKE
ncbi:unnamed protein product, partial [Amoebophrya sp. A25]|eukprot:GSA25T00000992001.1